LLLQIFVGIGKWTVEVWAPQGEFRLFAGEVGAEGQQDLCEDNGEDEGENECSDEALPSLLGGEGDERSLAHGASAYIGENIVPNDKASGDEEPDHAVIDIYVHRGALQRDDDDGHVSPGEQLELVLIESSLERQYKHDESDSV